jgi:hypothetical protein
MLSCMRTVLQLGQNSSMYCWYCRVIEPILAEISYLEPCKAIG